MVYNPAAFTALLRALQLTQGLSKPSPGTLSISVTNPPPALDGPVSTPSDIVSTGSSVGQRLLDGRSAQDGSCGACTTTPITATSAPFDQDMATIMRYRQQQSVNLGSWFVHENWMTPSLFEGASGKKLSEMDIAFGWGCIDCARSALERHWDTFITRSDFQYLASIGINTVRLPIGYWNLGPHYCQGTPFDTVGEVYQNSWSRILRALNMAAEFGIGVLVDLHGAVGSQNGQPHSGISDGNTNLFKNISNVEKTLDVLTYLAQTLTTITNVVGIQILNEPENVPELTDFYSQAITAMRQISPQLPIYVHDGFDLQRFTDYVAGRTDFVVQDHHSYFVFTPSDDAEPAAQHTGDIHGPISDTFDGASKKQHRNLVIDEWSCALTPKSIANEPDKLQARKDFCTGQLHVYTNTTAGWSFWSYLKEGCDDDPGWCFKAAVGNSLPSTFFSYPQGQMDDWHLQSLLDTIANMAPPSDSDVLAKFQQGPAPSSLSGRQHLDGSLRTRDLHHRFGVIHLRRRQDHFDQWDLTAMQRSILQGYSDGFDAGKKFAVKGKLSRLGFVGQYMFDSSALLGSTVIAPGTEDDYRRAFVRGLSDIEEIIKSILQS